MFQPCLYELRTVDFYHTQQFAQGAFRNARHIVAQEGLAGTCDPNLCRVPSRISLGNEDMNRFKGIGFISPRVRKSYAECRQTGFTALEGCLPEVASMDVTW